MKKLLIAMSMFVAVLFSANSANAQQFTTDQLNTAVGNLVALQGVVVNVDVDDVITIGNITVTDVVNVSNVLNNNNIDISILNGLTITIDDTLNNLLRNADIISNNQIVVGILSGQLLILNQKTKKK